MSYVGVINLMIFTFHDQHSAVNVKLEVDIRLLLLPFAWNKPLYLLSQTRGTFREKCPPASTCTTHTNHFRYRQVSLALELTDREFT